jgi:hypothetical protein
METQPGALSEPEICKSSVLHISDQSHTHPYKTHVERFPITYADHTKPMLRVTAERRTGGAWRRMCEVPGLRTTRQQRGRG